MIYLGADHAGYKLKEEIKKYLTKLRVDFEDLGAEKLNPEDDYPDFAKKVAEKVSENSENKGIIICGTGLGSCIVANKVNGIRATSAWNRDTARKSREHLDANVLCLAGRIQATEEAEEIVRVWRKKITLLFVQGCHTYHQAFDELVSTLRGSGQPPRLEAILVTSDEEAQKYKFFGSPTVQVDGIDVDPKAKAVTKYGMSSCRPYL